MVDTLQLSSTALTLFQIDLPNLSFQNNFLLDVIHFVAMIDMSCRIPCPGILPVTLYRDHTLRSLRQAVGILSPGNMQAVKAASLLLAMTSLAADRVMEYPGLWVTNWLTLGTGTKLFLPSSGNFPFWKNHDKNKAAVHTAGHFDDLPAPVLMPIELRRLLLITRDDDDWTHRNALFEAATGISNIIGSLTLPSHKPWIEYKIITWAFGVVSDHFINMVRQERPRALVILAYYLIFFNYLPSVWLFDRTATHDMSKLAKMIDSDWKEYLSTPLAALQLSDNVALTEFLVSLSGNADVDESLFQPFFLSPMAC